MLVSETHDDEENGQDSKTAQLNSLAADSINSSNRDPVSRNSTGKNDNDVADSGVVQELVDIVGILGRVPNDLENGTVIQRETIKGHIEAEP